MFEHRRITPHLSVLMRIAKDVVGPVASHNKVVNCVCLKVKTVANEGVAPRVELDNRVLEASSLKCDYRCSSDEKFLLHNASRFEHGRHHAKVSPKINQIAIREKEVRVCPKSIRVVSSETAHNFTAATAISVGTRRHAANEKHNAIVRCAQELFHGLQD